MLANLCKPTCKNLHWLAFSFEQALDHEQALVLKLYGVISSTICPRHSNFEPYTNQEEFCISYTDHSTLLILYIPYFESCNELSKHNFLWLYLISTYCQSSWPNSHQFSKLGWSFMSIAWTKDCWKTFVK